MHTYDVKPLFNSFKNISPDQRERNCLISSYPFHDDLFFSDFSMSPQIQADQEKVKQASTEQSTTIPGSATDATGASSGSEGKTRAMEHPPAISETMPPNHGHSTQCITADRALAHILSIEPTMFEALSRLRYDGHYRIQVGFNPVMLESGVLVEQIYVTLENAFCKRLAKVDVCSVFAPVFAPFPGIVYTPKKEYHIPAGNHSEAITQPKGKVFSNLSIYTHNQVGGESPSVRSSTGRENDQGPRKGGGSKNLGDRGCVGPNGNDGVGGNEPSGGGGGAKKANRLAERQSLSIPSFGSALTITDPSGSHQVDAIGGLEVTVSYVHAAAISRLISLIMAM
jgi:hypothetical protein